MFPCYPSFRTPPNGPSTPHFRQHSSRLCQLWLESHVLFAPETEPNVNSPHVCRHLTHCHLHRPHQISEIFIPRDVRNVAHGSSMGSLADVLNRSDPSTLSTLKISSLSLVDSNAPSISMRKRVGTLFARVLPVDSKDSPVMIPKSKFLERVSS